MMSLLLLGVAQNELPNVPLVNFYDRGFILVGRMKEF